MLSERADSGVHGAHSDGIPELSWLLVDASGRPECGWNTDLSVDSTAVRALVGTAAAPAVGVEQIAAALTASPVRPRRSPAAPMVSEPLDAGISEEFSTGTGGVRCHAALLGRGSGARALVVVTRAFSDEDTALAASSIASALLGDPAADGRPRGASERGAARLSLCALDTHGRRLAARDPDGVFHAASTVKLGVAFAVLRAVDAGELSLRQRLVSTRTFPSGAAAGGAFTLARQESDRGMPPEGDQVTVEQCLERMIVVSSNEATNVLVQRIGLDAVAAAIRVSGARATRMTRLIGDTGAQQAGGLLLCTAADLAKLMHTLVRGDLLSRRSRELLERLLGAQRFPVLTEGLRDAREYGSKSGWDAGVRHDVAWFSGDGVGTVSLAVCTDGMEISAALTTMRALGAAVEQRARLIHD